ncbi:MAG: DedA family protein [Ardenticatenaceae bacterium]|nr:DedA family protein [Ardenticatenaceae bacterium]MCB9442861.1 DedA family protein [Ardenticatenaceae bacterium]
MDLVKSFVDLFLHLDEYLSIVIQNYGGWTYGLLFTVIFIETGLVVTPFLPGDSLLFAGGTFAAMGSLNIYFMWGLLFVAAVLGDTANYWIGHKLGLAIFDTQNRFLKKVLKKEYLEKTEAFYAKHGGKTIVLARFVPIVRTFAPFVAGVGTMNYGRFISYNVIGGFSWVTIFLFMGYFFGNIPFVKANFELVIIGIILVSVVPMFVEYMKARNEKKAKAAEPVS